MDRRALLAGAGLSFSTAVAGCLSADTNEESIFEIRFEEQEGDSAEVLRERVIVVNTSGEDRNISGYTLSYSSGYEYTFSGVLTVEAGAKVAVVSQGAGDSVAEADPPTYYRDADFPTLVLENGEETVLLFDREDELIVEATYRTE